jgi:predicted DNA binding CopG/RHH family protein
MSKNKTVNFGNVNIDTKDFQDENVRASISIRVPMGLLKAYKREADRRGIGYQTLMLNALQDNILSTDIEKMIDDKIEKALKRA